MRKSAGGLVPANTALFFKRIYHKESKRFKKAALHAANDPGAGAEELPYISFNIFFTACKSASTSSNDVA